MRSNTRRTQTYASYVMTGLYRVVTQRTHFSAIFTKFTRSALKVFKTHFKLKMTEIHEFLVKFFEGIVTHFFSAFISGPTFKSQKINVLFNIIKEKFKTKTSLTNTNVSVVRFARSALRTRTLLLTIGTPFAFWTIVANELTEGSRKSIFANALPFGFIKVK